MDVGIQMIFSTYGWPGMSDREAWQEEIRLARVADEVGFDVIWSVEHHFFDYSFCPDNTQVLSYLAALCSHADLGTAAIILPWNDADVLADVRRELMDGRFDPTAPTSHRPIGGVAFDS